MRGTAWLASGKTHIGRRSGGDEHGTRRQSHRTIRPLEDDALGVVVFVGIDLARLEILREEDALRQRL